VFFIELYCINKKTSGESQNHLENHVCKVLCYLLHYDTPSLTLSPVVRLSTAAESVVVVQNNLTQDRSHILIWWGVPYQPSWERYPG